MPIVARMMETLHVFALAIWMGGLMTGAFVASIIFRTMRELSPRFATFEAYPGPHADLGAGFIQARVFAVCDVVQFFAASIAVLTLIASVALRRAASQPSTLVRGTLLAAAVCLFSYHYFILAPRMNSNARAYWDAARAGQVEATERAHQEFMSDHPVSTRTHGLTSVFVVASFVAGAFALSGRGSTGPARPVTGQENP